MDAGGIWYITETPGNGDVTGTLVGPNPDSKSCPDVTWVVTGNIGYVSPWGAATPQASTTNIWVASDPSPATECAGWVPETGVEINGTIQNNGNDAGSGTLYNSDNGEFQYKITKSYLEALPTEITTAVGFGPGQYATVGRYRQTLVAPNGSDDIYQWRQVNETTGFGTNYDNCWFSGSAVARWSTVAGSTWNVGYYLVGPPFVTSVNEWVDDYIGWSQTSVTYYRTHLTPNSFLCGAQVPQAMNIAVNGTSGTTSTYANDYIASKIYTNYVTVMRAGVTQQSNHYQSYRGTNVIRTPNSILPLIAAFAFLVLNSFDARAASTFSVSDFRPLNAVSDVLERAIGVPVNYEDPPYFNQADLEDVQLLKYGFVTPGYQLLVPRRGTVTGALLAGPTSSDAEKLANIEALLSDYRSKKLPGDFNVEEANGMFYVVPVKALTKSGAMLNVASLMSLPVSFPASEMPVNDAIQLVLDSVGQTARVKIGLAALLFWPTQKVTMQANGEAARDVLQKIIKAGTAGNVTYRLLNDPQPGSGYLMSLHFTGSKEDQF